MMNIVILGDGGHSKVIQDMIACYEDQRVVAILDDKYDMISKNNGILYGPLFYIQHISKWDVKIMIAIGNNETRKLLSKKLAIPSHKYLTIIHPKAVVSPRAMIDHGTVVMPHVSVNAGAIIGKHCIVNTGSIVEHDNIVGNYAHISPNATLTGHVSIGEGTHIGASATVIPGILIGHWSVIGAGSTVIKDIPPYSKAVGSPTRLLHHDEHHEKIRDKVVVLYEET